MNIPLHSRISSSIWSYALGLAVPALVLSGCAQFIPQGIAPKNDIPVYDQNTTVTVMDPIALSIKRCYWKDDFEKPDFSVIKPQGKFLVVEIQAVNNGNAPAQWSQIRPPVFALENSFGATFVCEGGDVNLDDFGGQIIMGRGILNPGRSLPGKLLFDVAPGDYTLNFGLSSYYQAGSYRARGYSFKWRFSPTEGK